MVQLDRRLNRPHAEIAYVDLRTAAPETAVCAAVVLLHGAGMDHSMWSVQAEALRDAGYRVIVWDMRGHGASSLAEATPFTGQDALADLDALLDACGVPRATLVGHSIGGNLAQEYARMHPGRVAGVVAVDSTWNAGPLTAFERFALRLAAPSLRLIPARTLPGLMARASAITPEAVERTEAVFARMPKPRFLEVWGAAVSFVAPDPGYRSPVPLALIRGEQDATGNIASAMRAWAEFEGVDEHVVSNAGHIVTWDAPEETTETLLRVLGDEEAA
ncbi:alpha/beta hydrolase [Leucobacter sp. gxy201]|uniref:alpha/beta fold hydrolase n=1 Tax=Leucobacter sp. gxy201 TaxID=2957200 RepID=UPI003DA17D81